MLSGFPLGAWQVCLLTGPWSSRTTQRQWLARSRAKHRDTVGSLGVLSGVCLPGSPGGQDCSWTIPGSGWSLVKGHFTIYSQTKFGGLASRGSHIEDRRGWCQVTAHITVHSPDKARPVGLVPKVWEWLLPGPLAYGAADRTKAKWSCPCVHGIQSCFWVCSQDHSQPVSHLGADLPSQNGSWSRSCLSLTTPYLDPKAPIRAVLSRGDTRQKGVPISHHSADNTSKMSFKSLNSRFSLFLLLLVDVLNSLSCCFKL